MKIPTPYLMFLGDAPDQLAAKTAAGVAQWRPEWCVGQLRLDGCQADLGLPDKTLQDAAEAGARTLLVGVVNQGGFFNDDWSNTLLAAVDLGYNIASGLHSKLADVPGLAEAAAAKGVALFDVRHSTENFDTGKGHKRTGKRFLTVGTDVSVGKMYTSLAVEREMLSRGMKATFRATGQTGIFIAGEGVSVDAVVSDFVSGVAEQLSPDNEPDHWDVVEGQGSLFHAAYAGVTLGLLHGSQPDAVVVCHDPGRPHMRGTPAIPVHSLTETIDVNIAAGRLTNPDIRCIGVAINTSRLSESETADVLGAAEAETGLSAVDPLKNGVARLVDALT
jgi:D-glutamate N-acetyltransferase